MGNETSRMFRRWGAALVAAATVALAVVVVPAFTSPVAAASAKVTICHRTHSTTNPYRRITVSQSAITRNSGHGGHEAASGNPAVFDATFSYQPNNKSWGDVIPGGDADGTPYNGANSFDLNWTAAGKAVFGSIACGGMTAKQFYDVEIAAGVPEVDVIADLNEQSANEDAALLAALGGSFTLGNVGAWATAVSVVTNPATSVTATTATLNGTLTVGTTSTVAGFQYGTSPTLSGATTVAASPSPVTGSNKAVTAALSDLMPSTTYYFRTTGTTNAGADTEGVLLGSILPFETAAADTVVPAVQTITFDQPWDIVVGGGSQ